MARVNATNEEVPSNILNEVSDEKKDDIQGIASLISDDEIDVAPSTSFDFDNPDDVNGAEQNITGNDGNISNSTGTTQ